MSQFDQTTEKKAEDLCLNSFQTFDPKTDCCGRAFIKGRNSAKESLVIFAKYLHRQGCSCFQTHNGPLQICLRCVTIGAIQDRGDWPLEDA